MLAALLWMGYCEIMSLSPTSKQRLLKTLEYVFAAIAAMSFLGMFAIEWFISEYRPSLPNLHDGFVIPHRLNYILRYVTPFEDGLSTYLISLAALCFVLAAYLRTNRKRLTTD
jgi:hypothetical protein